MAFLTEAIENRGYDKLGYSDKERAEANGFGRPNLVRGIAAYKARTLDGVWATPPFLHNGCVLNIYELLSPVSERSRKFWVGSYEYDPVRLGYLSTESPGIFLLDTSLAGNLNIGHELKAGPRVSGVIGRLLAYHERMALIEYLKAMPDTPPVHYRHLHLSGTKRKLETC